MEDLIVKMAILPKFIYKFNMISMKSKLTFFVEIDNMVINFIWKCEGHKTATGIFKNKNKVEELTFLYFKTYYTAAVSI